MKKITHIREKLSDYRDSLRVAEAARKGQRIQTVDTPEGRIYEIIVNR